MNPLYLIAGVCVIVVVGIVLGMLLAFLSMRGGGRW